MVVQSKDLDVVGWVKKHTAAHAEIVHYGFWGRLARALEAVLFVWLFAIPLMFVPFLVILALPTAIALSVFFFMVRIRAPDVARDVEGTCPDCGAVQHFDVPVKFQLPLEIECANCSRELWLTEHHEAA